MIVPDVKDWTWVLDRPCPECGFDASTTPLAGVAPLVRSNAEDWDRLHAAGRVVAGRPDASTWSSLEYACHVRDVYRRFRVRLGLMLTEDDPLFPNWDQDATAELDRYELQDAVEVIAGLRLAATELAAALDAVTPEQAARHGRRSDGAQFTVSSIARYMIHDTIHHLWDVTRLRP